jgi:hypothetical protein
MLNIPKTLIIRMWLIYLILDINTTTHSRAIVINDPLTTAEIAKLIAAFACHMWTSIILL